MKKDLFSAYGLSVLYPENWGIFISPHKSFTRESGFVKIEEVTDSKKSEVSMGVRWETADTNSEDFMNKYMEEVEKQFKNNLKKNNRYKIYSNEIVQLDCGKAVYTRSSIQASHGIYSMLGKSQKFELMQAAYYCDASARIIVSSISATPEKMEVLSDDLKEILFGVKADG